MSGVNFEGRQLRKGATDAIIKFVNENGGDVPVNFKEMSDRISRNGPWVAVKTGGANSENPKRSQSQPPSLLLLIGRFRYAQQSNPVSEGFVCSVECRHERVL